jgi:hypothetical protein
LYLFNQEIFEKKGTGKINLRFLLLFRPRLLQVNFFRVIVTVIVVVFRVQLIAPSMAQKVINGFREDFICDCDADLHRGSMTSTI